MTPQRLEQIRQRSQDPDWNPCDSHANAGQADADRDELLEYIDLLHEDLRLTRQERDETKKACLVYRKEVARLADALDAAEGYVGRLEHERAALRRGQGTAPEPATPEHPPFHHTHPIPDSTKGE